MRFLSFTGPVVSIADICTAFYFDGNPVMGMIAYLLLHADIRVMRQINEDDSPCRVFNVSLLGRCNDVFSDNLFDGNEDIFHGCLPDLRVIGTLQLRTEGE